MDFDIQLFDADTEQLIRDCGVAVVPEVCAVSLVVDARDIAVDVVVDSHIGAGTYTLTTPAPPGGGAGQQAPTPADRALARRLYSYGMVSPLKEKLPLNVGNGEPSTISWPTRNQSGSRSALRIHICRSPANGGLVGRGADSHKKLPP